MKEYRVTYLIDGAELYTTCWLPQSELEARILAEDFEIGDVYDVETR